MGKCPGHMDADECENLIDTFIEHRSGEDDRLPVQTFFELLSEQQAAAESVEIHITLAETGLVITASPDAHVTIEGHRIRFADGRELGLHFDPDVPETIPA